MRKNSDSDKQSITNSMAKKFISWIDFRTKAEEILELFLFFGGIVFIILTLLEILPFGHLGIGICTTLAFIAASRFILTNSFTEYHNLHEEEPGQGFVDNASGILQFFKWMVLPTFLAITGITLIVFGFGKLGILGFYFGIPSLGLSIMAPINIVCCNRSKCNDYCNDDGNLWDTEISDDLWGTFMIITGFMAIITFGILGLIGICTWQTVLALGAPIIAFDIPIAIIFGVTYGIYKYRCNSEQKIKDLGHQNQNLSNKQILSQKNQKKDKKPHCWFLGIGFGARD